MAKKPTFTEDKTEQKKKKPVLNANFFSTVLDPKETDENEEDEAKAAQEAADKKAKEEAEAKEAQEKADKKAKEEAEAKEAQEKADKKAKEEAEAKEAQEKADKKAKEEAEAKEAQEKADKKAKEEAEAKEAQEKADKKAKEEAEAKEAQEKADKKAKEEAEAKEAQEKADKKAKEEAEAKKAEKKKAAGEKMIKLSISADSIRNSQKHTITTQVREDLLTSLDQFVYTTKYTGKPHYSISQALEEALIALLDGQQVMELPDELQRKPYVVRYDKDIQSHSVFDKGKRKILHIGSEDECEAWAKEHYGS